MPEASPADRAAALIELAEKNAPRLGSEERQLIVAYAEAVGDTDKVIGLINRLCEQGYELQKGQMDSFVKSEIGSEIAVANAQRQIAQNPAAEPVVTILWSESPHLKDGQQMPLHEAEAFSRSWTVPDAMNGSSRAIRAIGTTRPSSALTLPCRASRTATRDGRTLATGTVP